MAGEDKRKRSNVYDWIGSMIRSLASADRASTIIIETIIFAGIWPVAWYLLTMWPMTEFVSIFYFGYIAGSFLFAIVSPALLAFGLVRLCNIDPDMRPFKLLVIPASIAYFYYIIWSMFMRDMTVFDYIIRITTTGPP
jgi:hypothetical protein